MKGLFSAKWNYSSELIRLTGVDLPWRFTKLGIKIETMSRYNKTHDSWLWFGTTFWFCVWFLLNLMVQWMHMQVENALKRNYKSYGAWHHRKWVLSKEHSSTDRELRLLNMFQKQDARNFHAWNYRRWKPGVGLI